MTQRERAIVAAFTGVFMGDFSTLHEYIEEVMGRPVWTHEMGNRVIADEIKEASRADFIALCEEPA